jgi:AcrR family transcriptional regulator
MKTKDKIVHASLKLFNQQGERMVTTNHIAEHLGMSPGLVYYHFKNKEAIIQAIFTLYMDNLRRVIHEPTEQSEAAEFLSVYCEEIFNGIWHYRFLLANMPALLAQDDELHKQYLEAHNFLESRASTAIKWLREREHIIIEDEQIPVLVDLMRLVTGSWAGFCMSNSMSVRITRTQVRSGIVHLIALLEPYGTVSGKQTLHALKVKYEVQ